MINTDRYVADVDIRQETFSPSNNQTVFALLASPVNLASVGFYVNGIKYEATVHFTLAGVNVTWLDTAFVMQTTGANSRVIRYVGLSEVDLGATFGALESGGTNISARNRVIQVGGAVYAVLNAGVYALQPDGTTWSNAALDGGLVFSDPSTAGDAVVRSGLSVVYISDVPHLVGVYRSSGGQLIGYTLNVNTGTWAEAAESIGLADVPTGANGGFWNEIVFRGQLHIFGSDAVTNLPRAFRFNPATGAYTSDTTAIFDAVDRGLDACVFNNRLHAVYRTSTDSLRLAEWVNGTWTDISEVDAGPIDAATDIHRRCVFTDQTNLYAIVGSDSTWRCWQLDGSFTTSDISIAVLPDELRSAAVGGGSFVGTPDGRMFAFADVDTVPGSLDIYLRYAADGTAGTPWTIYEWQGNAATMTSPGSVGDVAHALVSAKATGGEYIFTPSELDILITGKAPVLGGERIFFKAFGEPGPTNKVVEFYYNREGEPTTSLATLTGTAAGGVAVRVGNEVQDVQADGVTVYEVTWNINADAISTGDRVQLVPRISV